MANTDRNKVKVYRTHRFSRNSQMVPSATNGSKAKVSSHITFHWNPKAQAHRP